MLGHIVVIERGPIRQTNAKYIRPKALPGSAAWVNYQNQKIYKTVQNGMKFRSWDICWPLTDGKTKIRTYMYLKVGPGLLILGGYVGVALFNDQIDSTAF